jgi:hypothetical protein
MDERDLTPRSNNIPRPARSTLIAEKGRIRPFGKYPTGKRPWRSRQEQQQQQQQDMVSRVHCGKTGVSRTGHCASAHRICDGQGTTRIFVPRNVRGGSLLRICVDDRRTRKISGVISMPCYWSRMWRSTIVWDFMSRARSTSTLTAIN